MAKIVTLQVLVDDGGELDAEGFLKELLDNQAAEGGIEGPVFDYRFIGKPQQVPLEVEDAVMTSILANNAVDDAGPRRAQAVIVPNKRNSVASAQPAARNPALTVAADKPANVR
jgi:hypothetical protein